MGRLIDVDNIEYYLEEGGSVVAFKADIEQIPTADIDTDSAYAEGWTAAESKYRAMMSDGDCISRQAAIDLLKQMRKDGNMIPWEGKDVFARIRKLPSAQPEVRTQMSSADCISRQAAIDALKGLPTWWADSGGYYDGAQPPMEALLDPEDAISALENLPSAQPEPQWIPCSERLPEDLEEVNVTWVNHDPEPYYDFTKDKPATASAVYYKGKWYWYSSICTDLLAEYGENEVDKMDDAIEVLAWMPLPEPWKGANS